MIEPEVTAVLGRRYVAFLIDSALVVAAGLGVAYQQSTAFEIVGRDNADRPLVDPAEFDDMSALLDFEPLGRSEIFGWNVVRAQEIGDSVRVFGADSYQMGAIAALLVALMVFMVVPALIHRTIGMVPLNLTILDREGGRAAPSAHVKRTLYGVIDMVPGVIPGLLGMMIAGVSPLHQRLGDRMAGTVVVDRKTAQFRSPRADTQPVSLDLAATDEPPPPAGTDLVADPTEVGTAEPVDEALDRDQLIRAERGQPAGAPTGLTIADAPLPAVDEAPVVAHPLGALDPPPSAEPAGAPVDDSAGSAATQAAETDPVLPPPPVHRRPPTAGEAEAPTPGATADGPGAPLASPETVEASAPDPVDLAGAEPWQPPRSEPAPVWQPSPLDPAPVEHVDPHDGRTLDDVELSGIGELITADPLTADGPAPEDSARAADQGHATDQEASRPPVWSDKWRAWMYWDASKKCWLRHDTERDVWVPVD